MKRMTAVFLSLALILSLAACGKSTGAPKQKESASTEENLPESSGENGTTRTFTDSLGRKVELPAEEDKE